MKNIWTLLASLAFIVCCSDGKNQDAAPSLPTQEKLTNPDTEGLHQVPFAEPWSNDLRQRLQEYQVECEENCPPSIATFLGYQKLKDSEKLAYNVCGASLYDDKHVVMARHCLPIADVEKGDLCSDNGYFLFPATPQLEAQTARCLEVVDISPEYPRLGLEDQKPDWVLLRLDRSFPQRMVKVNREGLSDLHRLYFYPILYDREKKVVKIHRLKCKNHLGSLMVPASLRPMSPVLHITCDRLLSPGYSGFTFFNEFNEVVAVYSNTLFHKRDSHQVHSLMGSASNIACLQLDSDEPERVEQCHFIDEPTALKQRRLIVRKTRGSHPNLIAMLENWLETHPKHPVRWKEVTPEDVQKLPPHIRKRFGKSPTHSDTKGRKKNAAAGSPGTTPTTETFADEEKRSRAHFYSPMLPHCVDLGQLGAPGTQHRMGLRPLKIPVFYHHIGADPKTGKVRLQSDRLELPGVLTYSEDTQRFTIGVQSQPSRPKLAAEMVVVEKNGIFEPLDIPACP